MQRPAEELGFFGTFDDAAGIHDVDAVAHFRDDGEVVGDEDDGGAEIALALADEVEDLLLDGDVEGGGGFVANEQLGPGDEGHGDHDALAHAAGKFVRVGMDAALGLGDADFREGFDGAVEGFLAADVFMEGERLDELGADLHEGIQRGHGILENHGNALAADFAQFFLGHFKQVLAIEKRAAAVDAAGRLGDEA